VSTRQDYLAVAGRIRSGLTDLEHDRAIDVRWQVLDMRCPLGQRLWFASSALTVLQ
jgi:hypothetical protein